MIAGIKAGLTTALSTAVAGIRVFDSAEGRAHYRQFPSAVLVVERSQTERDGSPVRRWTEDGVVYLLTRTHARTVFVDLLLAAIDETQLETAWAALAAELGPGLYDSAGHFCRLAGIEEEEVDDEAKQERGAVRIATLEYRGGIYKTESWAALTLISPAPETN